MNFLRCGIEKLTPGYVRQALVALLTKLSPDAAEVLCHVVLSSSLRFFAAGSADGGEAWLRMNVDMSRKSEVCVGCSSLHY